MNLLSDNHQHSQSLRTSPDPELQPTRRAAPQPYQQRVDRHGRPFGNRVSTTAIRPTGPRNKIAPAIPPSQQNVARENSPANQSQRDYISPPYAKRRLNQDGEVRANENRRNHRLSPKLQWRAKSPVTNKETRSQERTSRSPRLSLGRNLDITDFSLLQEAQGPEAEHRNERRTPLCHLDV